MKTNQTMFVKLDLDDNHKFTLVIEHQTAMGNLTQLWAYGNQLREAKGKPPLDLRAYLRKPETIEYILAVEKMLKKENPVITCDSKCGDTPQLEVIENINNLSIEYDRYGRAKISGGELTCLKTKRGKYGGTWANLFILLDAAATLDADFKLLIYKTFINEQILDWRDKSGDNFKALNVAIDEYIPNTRGIGRNINTYINMARKIKEVVKPNGSDWNNASREQLNLRADIERDLVRSLRLGFIQNEDHLLNVVEAIAKF